MTIVYILNNHDEHSHTLQLLLLVLNKVRQKLVNMAHTTTPDWTIVLFVRYRMMNLVVLMCSMALSMCILT